MHLIKSLFVGAACVVAAVAQGVAFTATPGVVRPGESSLIKWTGGDSNTDAVISLYQGDARDLQFVRTIESMPPFSLLVATQIFIEASITDHARILAAARNGQFTWTIPADLPNRNDYSLQIDSGFDDNYSGRFTITGSTAVSSSSSSRSSTATATASSSSSSSSSSTATATAAVVQSVILSNITTTISDNNATTTVPAGVVGTGVGASGSAATGTAMSRNTTMARPTLSSTSSSSSEATSTSEESGSQPTGGSGSGGGEEAPSSGAVAMEVASFASPFALVLSAVAAIMFLA
ncbi:MAG: hypothetical protein L6R38_003943 [Xanthoria sp. 2 TBL-2021]|nr:MAG: hypothetical protein L6R38_003943 [Xanthoria sp. 2 TBL-2021]